MDILISFLIIIGILVAIVIYQSRKDKPNPKIYLYRFSRLIVIILSYFKDVGLCAAYKFREINWDLTAPKIVPGQTTLDTDHQNDTLPPQTATLPVQSHLSLNNNGNNKQPQPQPYIPQEGGLRRPFRK